VTLAVALTAGVLFGCGAYLLLQQDLLRGVAGVALISQASALVLIGAALTRGQAPISPRPGQPVSDPVPQALVLTALVIGLATLALLLSLAHRVVVEHRVARRRELAAHEEQHEQGLADEQQQDRDEAA
jgi:multicomponent Na+:H+ antiporter subunit C